MSEEFGTSVDSGAESTGASAAGEPVQETSSGQVSESQGFDQISAQADYTRKTQEVSKERETLAEQRRQFDMERQTWAQQMQQQPYQQPYQAPAQQPAWQQQPPYQAPYQQPYRAPDETQMLQQHLVDQFGGDGARVIDAYLKKTTGELQKQYLGYAYQSEYNKFLEQGKQKFGESFDKFNYKDPYGRPQGNRVIDLLAKAPELTLEQAYAAFAGSDLQKQEQAIREKIYAEQQRKEQGVPAMKTNQPKANGTGHATTVREAIEQAEAQLGKRL